ncbi:MAG: acyltransferase [Capsulimonadales bacterium]|nr:acyltransferase [Capsulimonadales bacterium]
MADGLRGLAILLVVLLHTWEITWVNYTRLLHLPFPVNFIPATGFLGVDLFFFLSGFCLTLPYARHRFESAPEPTVRHFLMRRAAKILPSYWLTVAVTFFLLPHPNVTADRLPFHLLTHLLFVHNWFFETGINSIHGVFWSLAVEVQFYALFPLLIGFFRRSPWLTVAGMTAVAQCWRAFVLFLFRMDQDVVMMDFRDLNPAGYLDLFAAGMAAAWVFMQWRHREGVRRSALLFTVIALVGFLALLGLMRACYATAPSGDPLRVWHLQFRLALSVTFAVVMIGSVFAVRPFRAIVANRGMTALAFISYNLYLWHQCVARWLNELNLPPSRMADRHEDTVWQVTFLLTAWSVSLLLATLLTRYWERPFLRGERLRFRPPGRQTAIPGPNRPGLAESPE